MHPFASSQERAPSHSGPGLTLTMPGLKVKRSINFCRIRMFFTAYVLCSLRLFKFETAGQTKQKTSSKSSKNEIEILPSPDTGDEYKETAYGRGHMQYQHRCVLTNVVRSTLSQVMCCIISGCGRRIFGYIYVKHFIALRGRRETNMLRKQPQKKVK